MKETYDTTTADLFRTTGVHLGGLAEKEFYIWKERSKEMRDEKPLKKEVSYSAKKTAAPELDNIYFIHL